MGTQSGSKHQSSRRVVLVTQPYWPDIQSTSHLLTELLDALDDGEIQFSVVCGYPALLGGGAAGKIPQHERRGEIEIFRCGLQGDQRSSVFRRLMGMLTFVLSATCRVIRIGPGATVCTLTNPPFAPIWIAALGKVFGFSWQLICHDVYPDGLVAVGKLRDGSWITRFWGLANRFALGEAEQVVVLGRDMAERVRQHYEVSEERIRVIPHWSVNDGGGDLLPSSTELWRSLAYEEDAFVVQYSGNMGLWHDIDTLVRAAALLVREEQIRFLFIGDGMRRAQAQALAKELGANNIEWQAFQPEEKLTDSLACCHVALISQRSRLTGIAVPCKLYGILASGRAVVGMVPDDSEVARTIAEADCGWRLDPDDAEGLAALLRELSKRPYEAREKGARAYHAFDTKYRLEHAASMYREIWRLNKSG